MLLPCFKHCWTRSQIFSHLLSSWEKFPIFQLNLAGLQFPWKNLGKTQAMHKFLMRWDNIRSRETSAKCPSCVWHQWSPGRKGSALTSNAPFGSSRPYPTQMSMNLPMLWSTILQLPKCIFTQCSKSVMLKKIYPLINQHSQPPSLGSCPSLFKRRKKLLWKLPQFFFSLFARKHFCINA